MEDLYASRITVLVPVGADSQKAENFALSNGAKVVFCNSKGESIGQSEKSIETGDQTEKSSTSGWFPWWLFGYSTPEEENDTHQEIVKELSELDENEDNPTTEEDNDTNQETMNEKNDDSTQSKLIVPDLFTPKDVFVGLWMDKFEVNKNESVEEWNTLSPKEKLVFERLAEDRNKPIIDKFVKDNPSAHWTLNWLAEEISK